ncbi:hypothetical protein B0H11DRAFT_1922367 [Mycena galericulata]|nr:hypothetical protein B0H11DRAFT_1922367 [Mycena galericulata]
MSSSSSAPTLPVSSNIFRCIGPPLPALTVSDYTSRLPALLEALQFAPFLGNLEAATYEDAIPDFTVSVVIGLGHVGGTHQTLSDNSCLFPVTGGDFIKNLKQT